MGKIKTLILVLALILLITIPILILGDTLNSNTGDDSNDQNAILPKEIWLEKIGVNDKDGLFLIKREVIENMGENAPSILHPLCLWEYSEDKVLDALLKIGWEQPGINDSNSTNCTLNSFACYNHLEKYGFHPYAFDTAGLVRSGEMSREEGIMKLNQELSQPLIEEAAKKLNFNMKNLEIENSQKTSSTI